MLQTKKGDKSLVPFPVGAAVSSCDMRQALVSGDILDLSEACQCNLGA